MNNPIDKDKVAEYPGLIAYPHTIGSLAIKPDDVGKLKSRALSAMHEQTQNQLFHIQNQVELLLKQANEIKKRVDVSEKIYTAVMSFEPFVGNNYHLYKKDDVYKLMLIGPDEWGTRVSHSLEFIGSVRLLSDHTWEIL
ncbi:MAG: DUF2452 domain-containing protein [Bacteroidota bacterium]